MTGAFLKSIGYAFHLSVWVTLVAPASCSFAQVEGSGNSVSGDTDSIIWDEKRRGWQVGAKLLHATSKLQLGEPVVVQFLLRNVSDQERTVLLRQYDGTFPVLGVANHITLNISGGDGRRHTIAPGETLEQQQYRVTIGTKGLLPGQYEISAQPAFWQLKEGDPNRSTGIGRKTPVRFSLQGPESVSLSETPDDDNPETRIHWGKPVAGLVVGMRLPQGRERWSVDSRIEGEMFIRNLNRHAVEFEYEIPTLTDWNMNVVDEDGKYVRLDWVTYSGLRRRVTRSLQLEPAEQVPLTGMTAEVQIAGIALLGRSPRSETRKIIGPTLQVQPTHTEFHPGDPRRLIATRGSFQWTACITVRQDAIKDIRMVVCSKPVPFSLTEPVSVRSDPIHRALCFANRMHAVTTN